MVTVYKVIVRLEQEMQVNRRIKQYVHRKSRLANNNRHEEIWDLIDSVSEGFPI